MDFYWPLMLIVSTNIVYHLCAKLVPAKMHPLATLGIVYMIAMFVSFGLYFAASPVRSLSAEIREINWAPFAMGMAIVGLEFGYISLYKVGWNISIGSLIANIILALILVFIGVLFFKEQMSTHKVIGVVVCLAGLVLINR